MKTSEQDKSVSGNASAPAETKGQTSRDDSAPSELVRRVFHFSYIGVADRTPPPVVIGSSRAAIDEFLALHRQEAALAYAQRVVASSEQVACISQALQGKLPSKPTDAVAQPTEVVLLGDWTVEKEVSARLTADAALPVLKTVADCLKQHAQSADALNGLIAFVAKQAGTR